MIMSWFGGGELWNDGGTGLNQGMHDFELTFIGISEQVLGVYSGTAENIFGKQVFIFPTEFDVVSKVNVEVKSKWLDVPDTEIIYFYKSSVHHIGVFSPTQLPLTL